MSQQWEALIQRLIQRGLVRSPNVISALRRVPRSLFLPEEVKSNAAMDCPLPIGSGQTASAPHMIAIMNEALELEVGHKVLEVGAGSGWHASTIAEIIAPSDIPEERLGHVYTLERIPELVESAVGNIAEAGYYDRITLIHRDGSLGYSEEAPYHRILVTAAAPAVPQPLIDQLRDGGILVIPVGGAQFYQTLLRIRKKNGEIHEENLGGVAFVPLIGTFGFKQ